MPRSTGYGSCDSTPPFAFFASVLVGDVSKFLGEEQAALDLAASYRGVMGGMLGLDGGAPLGWF
jgi:hypothetical protein